MNPKRQRMTLIAVVALGISFTAVAQVVLKKSISSAAAKKAIAACETLSQGKGWAQTIAVVDEAGNQMAFLKMDGAALNTIDFALGKARSALRIQAASSELLDRLGRGESQVLAWGLLPGRGGLPIKIDGQTIGAVGVSGSGSENDEACARAAVEAALGK
jgi:glc operon protein GlcG